MSLTNSPFGQLDITNIGKQKDYPTEVENVIHSLPKLTLLARYHKIIKSLILVQILSIFAV